MVSNGDFDPAEVEVQRRLVERALLRIREGGHPLLRDIAEGVLKGEMTLEELSRSSAAAAAMQAATTKYLEWHEGLTSEEQETLVTQVTACLDQMRAEVAAEQESGRA